MLFRSVFCISVFFIELFTFYDACVGFVGVNLEFQSMLLRYHFGCLFSIRVHPLFPFAIHVILRFLQVAVQITCMI